MSRGQDGRKEVCNRGHNTGKDPEAGGGRGPRGVEGSQDACTLVSKGELVGSNGLRPAGERGWDVIPRPAGATGGV